MGCVDGDVQLDDTQKSLESNTLLNVNIFYGGSFYPFCGRGLWYDGRITAGAAELVCGKLGFESGEAVQFEFPEGLNTKLPKMPIGECPLGTEQWDKCGASYSTENISGRRMSIDDNSGT